MTQGHLFDAAPPPPRRVTTPGAGITARLRAHLEAIGALNPDGVGVAIAAGRCPRCSADVLRGLDGKRLALPVVADAVEVDEFGEALAIAVGRARWWVGRFPDSQRRPVWEFVPRGIEHIGKPARGPIFIEHRCHAPPPATPTTRFPAPVTTHYSSNPPF